MARAILLQGGNSIDTDGINASSTNILKGKTTIDVNGEPLEGTIESVNASTFSPSSNVTTMVATTTAKYLAGNQTINAVTTQNFSAGNIKSGVNVKVGTTANAGSIVNITGTFGNGANVAAGRMLKNKTAYNGTSKTTGTITSKAAATYNYSTDVQTIASGQYLSGAQVINGVQGSAQASNVRSGYTFWSSKGASLQTGTMGTFAATTHSLASAKTYATQNKYCSGNITVPKVPISTSFITGNIKNGVTITIAGSAIKGTFSGYVTNAYDIYKYGSWGSGWSLSYLKGNTFPYKINNYARDVSKTGTVTSGVSESTSHTLSLKTYEIGGDRYDYESIIYINKQIELYNYNYFCLQGLGKFTNKLEAIADTTIGGTVGSTYQSDDTWVRYAYGSTIGANYKFYDDLHDTYSYVIDYSGTVSSRGHMSDSYKMYYRESSPQGTGGIIKCTIRKTGSHNLVYQGQKYYMSFTVGSGNWWVKPENELCSCYWANGIGRIYFE